MEAKTSPLKIVQLLSMQPWSLPLTIPCSTFPYYRRYASKFLIVCLFQGWNGYWGLPWFPPLPADVSLFAEIPKVVNSLCTIYNGVLGTQTLRQTSGIGNRKMRPHYTDAFRFLTVRLTSNNLYIKVQLHSFQLV